MKTKRKKIRMLVTVSVPAGMSASDARREVRHLINDQCNFIFECGDIIVRAVRPAPMEAKDG